MKIDQEKLKKVKLEKLVPDKVARGKRQSQLPLKPICGFPALGARVNIKFIPSNNDMDKILTIAPFNAKRMAGPHSQRNAREKLSITQKDIQVLKKLESTILDWLSKNKENIALFVTDPIAALNKMGTGMDQGLLRKIARANQIAESGKTAIPKMRFSTIKAKVVDTEKTDLFRK